jgi:hypothetical protein
MNQSEETYLRDYRDAASKKTAIEGLIGTVHELCESLKDWQGTAAKMHATYSATDVGWSEERINSLASLRKLLWEYNLVVDRLARAWSEMKPEEKIGLCNPSALKHGNETKETS